MTLDTALLSIIFVSNGFPVFQVVQTNDNVIMPIAVQEYPAGVGVDRLCLPWSS